MEQALKDFFISYRGQDQAWAEWIAWQLEEAHYSVILQAWDFRPGSSFINEMNKANMEARCTIAVLSPDYFTSPYTAVEWQAAYQKNPTGEQGFLIPVRVRPYEVKGLLGTLVYIDLVGLDAPAARNTLLTGIRRDASDRPARAKPPNSPGFPGGVLHTVTEPHTFPGTFPGIWKIPSQRNPFFTGRTEVLQQIHDTFTSAEATPIRPQALSGLGGIGKTQIALEYAYRYQSNYSAVLWLKADSLEVLTSDYINLAYLLNLPEKGEQDQSRVIQAVQAWFNTHTGWLLIVDNADDLPMVRNFLPTAGIGHILLTTQGHSARRIVQSIPLEKMGLEEGMLFMLRRANINPPEASLEDASPQDRAVIEQLVQLMDGHPLALDQAGAYIEETACSLSDYLHLYQTQQAELLKRRGELTFDHPESVVATCSLAFKKVARANPAASELLKFFAFLHPDAIPEELITEGAAFLGSILQPIAADQEKLNMVIAALLNYSLVSRNMAMHTLTMHRLVQAILKSEMKEDTQRRWAVRTVCAVNKAFEDAALERWERYWLYPPQAHVCAALIQQWEIISTEAVALLRRTGTYLQENVRYAEAAPFLKQAMETVYEQTPNPKPLEVAASLSDLGILYQKQGKYEQAEPLLQRALAIYEQVLGPEHPDTAASLNNLVELYNNSGRYEQVELLYKGVLSIREKVLGAKHFEVVKVLNDLAYLYYDQERYTEAEPLYRRALDICEQTLGDEQLTIAFCLNNLAAVYDAQGKYAQAEPLYQRALSIREKILKPDHPDVVLLLENYADLLRKTKRKKEAAQLEARIKMLVDNKQRL